MPWANTVCPDVVHAAHFEQEILFRLVDLDTPYPEVLEGRNGGFDPNIESSWKQALSCGGGKDVRIFGHALSKVADTVNKLTLDFEHVADA